MNPKRSSWPGLLLGISLLLALITYVLMIAMGIKAQGLRYFADIIWPPGIPLGFRPLVGVIDYGGPVDHGSAWSLYFTDPDGNPLEITCPAPPGTGTV